MGKQKRVLTELEWILMDALWIAGPATASDVQKQLADSQGWAYSTVKTMLDRLVKLEYVKARRIGNVYEYSAKTKRPTVVGKIVDDVTDRLFNGATAPFIQCLLERGQLSDEELSELRERLDRHKDNQEEK